MGSASLEQLYDQHAGALYAFLLNLSRHQADARDLLQEIFLRLARRPGLLDGARDHRAFLLRMGHNMFLDLLRRRAAAQRTVDHLAEDDPPLFAHSHDPDEQQFRLRVAAALALLPPEQRAVVHLKIWEDMTFEAIADLLDVPLNTVASRYRYGLDKLRHGLRPLYDEGQ